MKVEEEVHKKKKNARMLETDTKKKTIIINKLKKKI